MTDIEQTQKMIPFITCEISLCQYVCELVLGVNVFDLNLEIKIDSIKQPIKCNSVGSGNVSHWRTSSHYDHLDHFRVGDVDRFPWTCSLWFVFPWRTVTIRSHRSSAGIPSILKPAFKEMISVRNWSLFLTHPADWNELVASETTQCSTWCRFWILKISCKIGVLRLS